MYSNFHLLLSPLTHSSTQQLQSETPPSQWVKPAVSPTSSHPISLLLTLNGDPIWDGSNVGVYGKGEVVGMNVVLHSTNSTYLLSLSTTTKTPPPAPTFLSTVTEYGILVSVYRYLFALSDLASYPTTHVLLSPSTIRLMTGNRTVQIEGRVKVGDVEVKGRAKATKVMERKIEGDKRLLWKDFRSPSFAPSTRSSPSPPAPDLSTHLKTSISIRLVTDTSSYPYQLTNGMDVRQTQGSNLVYLPSVFLDETGSTSDRFTPLNSSSFQPTTLRVTLDTNLTPSRWRLLSHMGGVMEGQKEMGLADDDIDDVRRLIADTSLVYLAVTISASLLHLLFEILSFREDVAFWAGNESLRGLSVRQLVADSGCQLGEHWTERAKRQMGL